LVDSGAYAVFVNHRFVRRCKLKMNELAREIHVYNTDRSRNRSRSIRQYVWLDVMVGEHSSCQACLVTDLGGKNMFLSFSYLKKHNPEIDWQRG
ncbi:hypothetical protein CERSUDRAFT_36649, partial [Gelatoporia subvermispora B]